MNPLRPRTLTALAAGAVVALAASAASAITFAGNGGTGFGGPIGTGQIALTEGPGGVINFSLTTGVPFSGNALVLYVDSKAGGVGSTSSLTDTGDPGRRAISGLSDAGRTLAVFPAGFTADYAITVEPGNFSGVFDINNTPGAFGFVASGGLSGSGTGPFTFSVSRSALGLGPADTLSFVGSLISTSAYRSNETFGTSVTVPGSVGDTPNAGFTGTTTFALANTYAVPAPSTVALLGLAGAACLRRRR